MRNRPKVSAGAALAVWFWLAAAWFAQPAFASDARQDAAETAAAMERAKRLAANPLRVILEASKVKRKIVAEPEAAPAATAPAAQSALVPAAPVAPVAPIAPIAPISPVSLGAPFAASPLPARSEVAPSTPQTFGRPPPVRTLSAAPIAAALAAGVPAMPATDRLSAPAAMPATAGPAAPSAAAWAPRLIDMVEPVIPQRLLEQIGATVEFNADLTLRPDGTVARVSLVAPANRTIARYMVAAMERWRFAPLPAEQIHRVQLVFKDR